MVPKDKAMVAPDDGVFFSIVPRNILLIWNYKYYSKFEIQILKLFKIQTEIYEKNYPKTKSIEKQNFLNSNQTQNVTKSKTLWKSKQKSVGFFLQYLVDSGQFYMWPLIIGKKE